MKMKSTILPFAIFCSALLGDLAGTVVARPYTYYSYHKKTKIADRSYSTESYTSTSSTSTYSTATPTSTSSTVTGPPTTSNPNNITDTQILQFALTLENLENAFYTQALAKFDSDAFTSAGFPSWVRGRFEQLSEHENTHVTFLKTALGNDSVDPCNYSFPYTDPLSFVALSSVLEGVGTGAYLGAAPFIENKQNLVVAGSILATEARHQSWVQSSGLNSTPWSSSFETPLTFNQSFTLASSFITSCPSSNNFTLAVKAFPQLNVSILDPPQDNDYGNGTSNLEVQITFPVDNSTTSSNSTEYWLALLHGLQTSFVSFNLSSASNDTSTNTTSATITLPNGLQGTVYALVSSSNTSTADNVTIAGPAILSFPFDDQAQNA